MDVSQSKIQALLFTFLLTATACGQNKTPQAVFPKVTEECADQALQGRYIVRWEGGRVTLYEADSDLVVMKELVEENLENIELVEPDYRIRLNAREKYTSDGLSPVADNWGPARINADQAWALGYRGAGITVAVIDSAVDADHIQLRNQLARNPLEIPDNRIDDDHNGYVDDVHGFDFAQNSGRSSAAGDHGTHVSGIIAAEHFDSDAGARGYVQGIAPQAKILPLAFIGSEGSGSLIDAMRAIDYAAQQGAQIINASWGGAACSTILRDQIGGLYTKKIIFVAASGNSGLNLDQFPEYPAGFNLRAQVTVGAVGRFDSRATFSNYGEQGVHLFAPGVDIYSTLPNHSVGPMSGTSMATPMVAAAVAVLLSARPDTSIDRVRQILYQSAHQDFAYRNASHGRLDLGRAIEFLLQ